MKTQTCVHAVLSNDVPLATMGEESNPANNRPPSLNDELADSLALRHRLGRRWACRSVS